MAANATSFTTEECLSYNRVVRKIYFHPTSLLYVLTNSSHESVSELFLQAILGLIFHDVLIATTYTSELNNKNQE